MDGLGNGIIHFRSYFYCNDVLGRSKIWSKIEYTSTHEIRASILNPLSMPITTTTKSAPIFCIKRQINNSPDDSPINEPEANPIRNIKDLNLLLPIASNNAIKNIPPQK